MNKYIYLNNLNVVWEILDEFNPVFPGVPIQERYSKQFLDQCLVMSEEEFNASNINLNMIYDEEANTFNYPEPIASPEEKDSIEEKHQEEELSEQEVSE